MKLSIAMIVKNEENNLDRTLEAVSNINTSLECEIIIVDTGSTDNTMEIAKRYTDKVYKHKWTGNFAEMRNISLSYCTGDWILVLDADEVLENPDELINFLNSEKGELFNSATVEIRNYNRKINQVNSEAALVRMFRNVEGLKYTGRVHEQPINLPPLAHSNISFLHYGYSTDDYELMNYKFERNRKLLEEELKTAKGDYEIYVLFQLSKTYSLANRENEALKYIKQAYDKEKNRKDDLMHTFVYHWYATMLFNKKDYEKTLKICKELIKYYDKNLDIFYMMAISYSALGMFDNAYKYYDKYFKLRKDRENGVINEDLSLSEGSFQCYDKMVSNRMVCYFKQKKYDKFIKDFEKNKDVDFGDNIQSMYIYSCIVKDDLHKISEFYKEKEINDLEVENIIADFNDINVNGYVKDIESVKQVFSLLDIRIKIYFESLYNDSYDGIQEIDFSTYYNWKEKILEKLILKDIKNIEILRKGTNEIIKCYIENLCKNYECVDRVYKYIENKLLTVDIADLNFVCNIENVLLFNKSIAEEKYKTLVLRTLVDRNIFRKLVYNSEAMAEDEFRIILNEYDRLWFDIESMIKSYSENRLEYIKGLGKLIKSNTKYSSIIRVFLNEATDKAISIDMIKEKENIYKIVEEYISTDKINEAEEVLSQLADMFKWDGKILNYKGVIDYINGKYSDALLNLSLSSILMEDKFDSVYNIACVLEKQNRIKDCKKYYEYAYNICKDENDKLQIEEILKGLK